MKKTILCLIIGLICLGVWGIFGERSKAQKTTDMTDKNEQTVKVTDLPPTDVKIVDFKDIAAEEAARRKSGKKDLPVENPFMPDPLNGEREIPSNLSPLVKFDTKQDFLPNLLIPSPAASPSFQALNDNGASIPPDTHGAAGPNHLMTVLNTQVRIQSKTGTILSTVSLQTFFSAVAPSGGVFDPKVLYDPYSGRWIFTACVDRRSANSGVLLAVSQTNDPTGSWFLYRAVADSGGIDWADYPSFGFNKDWVVISVNMFANVNDANNGTRTFIFRKSSVYSGTFNAGVFIRPGTEGFTITPAITQSSTEATMHLISNWNGSSGLLRLYTITGAVGAETYTVTSIFPQSVGLTWQALAPDNFAPQMGGATGIMNGDSRMQNVVFRNGSLWATHSVVTPSSGTPTNNAVQWWQITPATGAVTQVGRVVETGRFFAYPSIAVNQNNDVLLGYSSFSANQFASANYSFRAAADTPGTLRDSATLKAGQDCYLKTFGAGRNRWGDYSNTIVDPTDDLSFWTLQEYADTSSPTGVCTDGSGRWATWWGKISPPGGTMTTARKPFDFDGDNKTDIGIFRPSNGQWWIQRSSTLVTNVATFGVSTDKTVPADYTGDGKTDIAFFRPSSNEWFILRSENNSFYSFPFGTNGDIPVPADYDADGKADPAVFRPSNQTWFILNSGGGTTITTFGVAGDRPVPADYDGDSRADIAIFRPSAGQWWINRSSNNSTFVVNFGVSTDKTVQGDYTGDGKADVAFWRPSSGEWFILRSENFSFFSFPFGVSTDLPVPGDYDGDGKIDAGVFRPGNLTWFINGSQAGSIIQTFGTTGDFPLPNSYVR